MPSFTARAAPSTLSIFERTRRLYSDPSSSASSGERFHPSPRPRPRRASTCSPSSRVDLLALAAITLHLPPPRRVAGVLERSVIEQPRTTRSRFPTITTTVPPTRTTTVPPTMTTTVPPTRTTTVPPTRTTTSKKSCCRATSRVSTARSRAEFATSGISCRCRI
jgi:hypothetical protein